MKCFFGELNWRIDKLLVFWFNWKSLRNPPQMNGNSHVDTRSSSSEIEIEANAPLGVHDAWIIRTNVYLSIKWTSVNLYLSRWTSPEWCVKTGKGFLPMWDSNCFDYDTLEPCHARHNEREKIDLSGRLTLIFRMLWQQKFYVVLLIKWKLFNWGNGLK